MGKYDDKSFKELKKEHASHNRGKSSRPDEDKYKDKDNKMKTSINGYKLRLAELKYELEQIRTKTDSLREKQKAKNKVLQDAQKTLQERKQQTQEVHRKLVEKMGLEGRALPKRIANPQDKLEAFEKEFRSEKNRLVSGDLTIGDEKKIMRNIKILENNISKVKEYMSQNVEQIFQEKNDSQKEVSKFRVTHEEAYQDYVKARDNASDHYSKLDVNRDEQKKIQKLIEQLQEQRTKASSKYKRDIDDYQIWTRKERELRAAMQSKQYDEELDSVTRAEPKKRAESKGADDRKDEEAKEKRARADEQVKSVEDRRAAAVAAYQQCQDNLKKKSRAPAGASHIVDIPEVSSKADDPHQAEKGLCRSLIAYCQSNLPSQRSSNDNSPKNKKKRRKKKKKIRLTHKPINFSNFAKVDVGIPIWSTDLGACIKELEERILSYDSPDANAEEDVKVTSI